MWGAGRQGCITAVISADCAPVAACSQQQGQLINSAITAGHTIQDSRQHVSARLCTTLPAAAHHRHRTAHP